MARIFFCGDIVNQFSDKQFVGESMTLVIAGADYAVCNLEGALASGKENNCGMLQHPVTLQAVKEAGFKLCLLANNHITDYGKEGLSFTLESLRKCGLESLGAGFGSDNVYKPFIVEISNQKIGFINVCEAQIGQFDDEECEHGYAWIGWPDLDKIISATKSAVDFLFVCVHAGLEHYEIPLKEFRSLYKRFCDWGADCVVGAHPHIAQGIEQYKDSYIFYSLGNFYFPRSIDADESDYENNSYSIVFDTKQRTYDLFYHSIKDRKVERVKDEDTKIDVVRLNNLLLPENYEAFLRQQNELAYDTLVQRLYQRALNGQEPQDCLLRKVKNIVKYIFNLANYKNNEANRRCRNALLQRLVENETYRYLTIDVLKHRNNE